MKKIALFALTACFLLGSISALAQRRTTSHSRSASTPVNFKMSNAKWSKSINLNQDISNLSYQDLYYLRALVYASHGKWYTEGNVFMMLNNKATWYQKLVDSRLENFEKKNPDYSENDFDKFLEGSALSAQEKAFVAKIEQRMKSLEASTMSGRSLESPQLCVNMCQIEKPSESLLSKLDKYNFAIEQTNCEQLFNIYEQNDYNMMPSFVTTDTYLQVAHMYLAYAQKYIEQEYFTKALANMFMALYNQAMTDANRSEGDVKDRSAFVATYAAIGVKLLTGKDLDQNDIYRNNYYTEIRNIESFQSVPSSFLQTGLNFPYSLFRPRGHYTRNDEMKRFFKAMMWAQTARFESNKASNMKRAFALAATYNKLPQDVRSEFEHMSDVITQLTGESDNVSILQMAKYLKSQGITSLSAIDEESKYMSLLAEMKKLNDNQNKLSSKAEAAVGFYINLMPQRFLVDNDILRNMVDDTPNAEFAYPRGLHVFEAFGSKSADDLAYNFYNDNQKWSKFTTKMDSLKALYSDKSIGMGTIYDRRLQILVEMAKDHSRNLQFSFYNTKDWQRKELNTALASWATLKHDAILYAEQPECAECGAGEILPPPMPMGFIEPNTKFWNELSRLISDTQEWLRKSGYMDESLESKTESLIENINFCKNIAAKEEKGIMPDYEERRSIKSIGSTLEWITLGLIDPSLELMSWDDIKGTDRSIAQIADIFTRTVIGCNKQGVLYSACGNANAIYVLVKIDGKTFITRGATYGYYEFVRPTDIPRLTDEEWQKELEKGSYSMPEWMEPYIIDGKVKTDERNFYGSGC